MNRKYIAPIALAALVAAGGVARAQEHDQDSHDLAAASGMKVTLQQAIAAAERQGGRAVGADVSQQGGVTRVAVELARPQGVKTVLVDGQTGQVTATREGAADSEAND